MHYEPFEYHQYKYVYLTYGNRNSCYLVRETPFERYARKYHPKSLSPKTMAESFLESSSSGKGESIDDLFAGKLELGRDRIDLLLDLVEQQEMIKYRNLASLYYDLFTLERLQTERPYPENYRFDSTRMKLTEDKLRVCEGIRKELQSHSKSLSFISRDLVNSLIDFKRQNKRQGLFLDDPLSGPLQNDREN